MDLESPDKVEALVQLRKYTEYLESDFEMKQIWPVAALSCGKQN